MYLKQHRKGVLELDDKKQKLKGNFEISLRSQHDREVMVEFITEIRKVLREAGKVAPKKGAVRKVKAKKSVARKKKARRRTR